MGKLDNRVALVVGSAGGIGRASCLALARDGAQIMAADLGDSSKEIADFLVAEGRDAAFASVDVRDETSVEAMVAATVERFGRLDVVHYNAAALSPEQQHGDGGVAEMMAHVWDEAMNVNVRGAMLTVKAALPPMLEGGSGSIIFSGSARGERADRRSTAYGVSKAALHHLARYVATQYGKAGIRCNAISIGVVMTEAAAAKLIEPLRSMLAEKHLTPDLGTPEDIADIVAFLASDASRFVTGSIINADGGFVSHIGMPARS